MGFIIEKIGYILYTELSYGSAVLGSVVPSPKREPKSPYSFVLSRREQGFNLFLIELRNHEIVTFVGFR